MTFFLTIAKLDQNRENNFDFIRFVAAAMVIFSHTYAVLKDNSSEPLSGATGFITFGSLAVEIFFIVSGYLVCKSLLMRSSPLAFVEARILRVFPALIICCALCTLLLGPILTRLPLGEYFGAAQTWHYLFDNATLLKLQWFLPGVFEHNPLPGVVNGSLWTLPTEFKMYLVLLAAGLIVLPFPSQRERVLLVMVAGCFVFAHITYPGRLVSHVSNDALPLILMFLAGNLLYLLRRAIPVSIWILAVAWGLAYAARQTAFFPVFYYMLLPYSIIVIALHPRLNLHAFGKYGDFSYGLYLYGFPVKQTIVAINAQWSSLQLFTLAFPLTLLLAVASWHLVEARAMRFKGWASGRLTCWMVRISRNVTGRFA